MLKTLSIRNYALIASLDIDLHDGFSVITGETGAGKSILLGAIALLMGQRAESRMIKDGATRCTIEAVFDIDGYGLEQFFTDNDLDYDAHTCTLRRELTAAGKSRAFVNDTPVQLSVLRALSEHLLDIHSQHQNMLLAHSDFQMSVVDLVAQDAELRQTYTEHYTQWQTARKLLTQAEQAAQQGHEDEDYLRFQLEQIEALHLTTGIQASREQEAQQLEHAEEIQQALGYTASVLNGQGQTGEGIVARLRDAARQLAQVAGVIPEANALEERIESCRIELQDIEQEATRMADASESDPSRLDELNEWLSSLYTLQRKHKVDTDQALMDLAADMRSRLDAIDNSEEHIHQLQAAVTEAHTAMMAVGRQLTAARKTAATSIEQEMEQRLVPLGIPNVRFAVSITPRKEPDASGTDTVDFLFSANKNSQPQPISQVASGGEIARVMLSLKALLSGLRAMPTIIFDEIDTGVSGQIAERMACIMNEMGAGGRQVISITHLPQIAAMAKHHFRVYKEDDEQGTESHIASLTMEERVTEIAHMLSGARLTEAAMANARTLLGLPVHHD